MIDLHIHTKYSLLDSISDLEELIKKTKELGRDAICLTEHGNLYSNIEMYKICQKYDLKFLHGCEMYICNDVNVKDKNNKYNHLVLISKNEAGRLNLIKLVSESNKYKYYGKPRIDFEMLKKHKEGLIVLSACMAGEIQQELLNNNIDNAKKIAKKYKKEFGEDYYLEYQSHEDNEQQKLNRKIVDLANELNIKYVVTTDAHYVNEEDQKYHDIFAKIGQSREVGETYNDCFIQKDDEILSKCQSTTLEENKIAIENTHEIAKKCNVEIPLSSPIMIHTDIPEEYNSEKEYLLKLCKDGWKYRKINQMSKEKQKKYIERLKYEMDIITKMGFEGYYLLVWSYANAVKRRGIARGSGGGSLVAYLTNIVDIDPVKYDLYFERFLDVGALELLEQGKISKKDLKIPDFDLDFGKEDRDKVVQNIIDNYGIERYANLGSFQYIWAKGAIKDIGRVLGLPFEETNKMTKKLNQETIAEVLELGLLDDYKEKYPDLFDYAEKLAGLPKSFSMHPCGKVICMEPVDYYNAVDIDEDSNTYILQGDMHTAEDLGLIKIDLLGLKTIDIIYDTLELIGKDYEYIAPHILDFEDETVIENFRNGNTDGVFQFESNGMKKTLENIECNSLYDLFVANALFRPGSMDYIENYAMRRKGLEEYEFLHEDLKDILKDTYAIIVFQEQLIEIGKLAGLNNPDELRKATGKKDEKLMNKIKPELHEKLKNRGWTDEQFEELWNVMLKFAKYSFNKSHSAAYAIIAYICMYLKIYHPKEFITSWINSLEGKTEKLPQCINEANRLGIKINYPDRKNIKGATHIKDNEIYLGSNNVKHLNYKIGEQLNKLKENNYNSIIDLLIDIKEKTSINSRQLYVLTCLDYFKEFGKSKKVLKFIELFDQLNNRKQLSKEKAKEMNIPEYIILKHSRSTEKTYMDLGVINLLKEIWETIENKQLSVKEKVQFEMEYLEHTTVKHEKANANLYIITEFKTYKDKAKPYVTLRHLKTGDDLKTKVKNSKYFSENPFELYNVLYVHKFKKQKKTKNIGGKWQKTNEDEYILDEWTAY